MYTNKKLTTEQFITKAKEVHGDKYSYELTEYINAKTKVKIVCPVHGVFEQIPNSHLKGCGCHECNGGIKLTTKKFVIKAKEVHGDKYSYELTEYVNAKTKVKITCPVHGVFEQTPDIHLRGSNCGFCKGSNISKVKRSTKEGFITKAKEVHGDRYSYERVDFKTVVDKVKIICPVHGVFEQTPYSHLRNGGCEKCSYVDRSNSRVIKNAEGFITKAKEVHGDKYSYERVVYIGCKDKVKITCPVHGEFEQTPDCHHQGQGCPKCVGSISQQEQELQQWLSQHIDITTNDRTLIAPLELDIIIPSKKIAIEYNGLYWHSEQRGKDRNYHLNKYNLCKERGYRLIQIWSNEWLLKKDIVKSILLSAIGQYERKIHGRKCEIRVVPSKEARIMYDNNHIQGFQGGGHHGLYFKNELISLMTIDRTGELQRFVNKKNTLVHGAFTKLLKSFDNTGDIHTFADLRYFTGNVYTINGFRYDKTIKPSYYYIDKGGHNTIHRRRFQKQYIEVNKYLSFDPNQTEYQNMLANGYDRIWDCGKIKYINYR